MAKLKKLSAIIVALVIMLSVASVQAFAATTTQDGLEVSLTTDKEEYSKNDQIVATLSVKNTNDTSVTNVSLENFIPNGYKLADKMQAIKQLETLNSGETATFAVTYVPVVERDKDETKATDNSSENTQINSDGKPLFTGENIGMIVLSAVLLIGSTIFIIVAIKKKKSKQLLSFILCAAVAGAALPTLSLNANAAETDTNAMTIEINKNAKVENEEIVLTAKVIYTINCVEATNLITIDTSNFSKNDSTDYYFLDKKIDVISGTLDESLLDADAFKLTITNVLGDTIVEKNISINKNWNVSGIGFMLGVNTVTVSATKNAKKYVYEIVVYNKSAENVNDNLMIDLSDTDGDKLLNYIEEKIGTDIEDADTDSDGLSDFVEVMMTYTDPLKKDSNDNGISDFDEDSDQDGLTNGQEIKIGSNPGLADSDADLLEDGEEVNKYKTDPNNDDTDGDGGKDGWEIEYGFDPITFDSSFTVTEGNSEVSKVDPVNAVVDVTIDGEQLGTVKVNKVNVTDNPMLSPSIAGYLGKAVELTVDGEIQSATLKMYYDTSLGTLGEEFQPRIYYYNEQTGGLEELTNQIIENGCVEAQLSHFSSYILLNKVELEKVWNTEIKDPILAEEGRETTIDVAFVCDTSGSMRWDSRISTARSAINEFIDALEEKDRGALVDFDDDSKVLSDFTSDKEYLKSLVSQLDAEGYTAIYKGFNDAIGLFSNPDNTYGYKMVIILTDGVDEPETTYDYYYEPLVQQAIDNEIVVYTIGVGNSVDKSILKQIAEKTGGKYYYASTAYDITESFAEIRGESVDLVTDSNDDGIPDYYNDLIKNGELVLTNGSTEFSGIDFNYDENGNLSNDYDGDGLINGKELIIQKDAYGRVTIKMNSDPTLIHSDSDLFTDNEEYGVSDPLRYDYDADAVDGLMDDSGYYAENMTSLYDDSFLFQLDSAFLSTINGLWNTGELYRDIMIDYFSSYEDNSSLEELERVGLVNNLVDNLFDGAEKVKAVVDTAYYIDEFDNNIKNFIDVIRGAKKTTEIKLAIEKEFISIMQKMEIICPGAGTMHIDSFEFSSYTKITIEKHSKLTPLQNDKLKGADIVFNVIDAGIDVVDTITSLNKVMINNKAFENNLDILHEFEENGYRQNIRDQAHKIIALEAEEFGNIYASEVGADFAEGAVNILITIASKNPYVSAIVFARDSIAFVTGIKEDLKQEYEVLAYTSMAYGLKNLIGNCSYRSGDYYYAYDDCDDDLRRYLKHLAQIRICGETKYCEWQKNEGWFGSKDNSKAENATKITKDYAKYYASLLNISLHSDLVK
ncbi:MAG: VWA domain-containing protein [Acutalibacteraceae bacterium]